jgi:carboxyl-terminal processing protease
MATRIEQVESPRPQYFPGVLAPAPARTAPRPPSSFAELRATRLLRGPSTEQALVLTPPSASRRGPLSVDKETIGRVLVAVATQYERPVTLEELTAEGLTHLIRHDGRLSATVEGNDVVLRDGERELARLSASDPTELAWGTLVAKSLEVIEQARPGIVPRQQLTSRFLAFLPERLDPYTGYTGGATGVDSGARFGMSITTHQGEPTLANVAEGSPTEAGGLASGDRLLAIAGENVRGWSTARVMELLARNTQAPVSFTVERDGKRLDVSIARTVYPSAENVTAYLHRGVAVIRVREIDMATTEEVTKRLEELRRVHPKLAGVVLDLRNNGGGSVAGGVDLADAFLDSGRIAEERYPRGAVEKAHDATLGDIARGLPMAVLINGGTFSSAELVALALSENGRATLVGTRSGAKGSMQVTPPLTPVRITVGRYYGPNGTSPHQVGVRPAVCTGPTPDPCAPAFKAPDGDIDAAIDLMSLRH